MATAAQVQNFASVYQQAVADLLRAADRINALKDYYGAFDLANDDSFPANAFVGSSLENKVDRGTFRDIVTNANSVADGVDAVPGRRFVMSKILDGVP